MSTEVDCEVLPQTILDVDDLASKPTFEGAVKGSGLFVVNSSYGVELLFDPEGKIGVEYGPGIKEAFKILFSKMELAGSVLTKAMNPLGNVLDDGRLSKVLFDLKTHTVSGGSAVNEPALIDRYFRGELNLESLSSEAYFGLHLLLGMWGSNLDIFGYDARDNVADTMQKVQRLLLFTYQYGYDGATRGISEVDYFGKFKYLHLGEYGQTSTSGINFLVFSDDHDDSMWRRTNWRRLQHATFIPGEKFDLDTKLDSDLLSQPIDLELPPETLGETMLHTARAIRTVITQSPEPAVTDSWSQALERVSLEDRTIRYEDLVGVTGNLMVAFFENPKLTRDLIRNSGLSGVLPNYSDDLLRVLQIVVKKYDDEFSHRKGNMGKLLQVLDGDKRIAIVRSFLKRTQTELFGGEIPVVEHLIDRHENSMRIKSISDLAPFIVLFLPVKAEDLKNYLTHDREKIIYEAANRDSRHVVRAIDVLNELKIETDDQSAIDALSQSVSKLKKILDRRATGTKF